MASFVCRMASLEEKAKSLIPQGKWSCQRRKKQRQRISFTSLIVSPAETFSMRTSQEMIDEAVIKQAALVGKSFGWSSRASAVESSTPARSNMLNAAYERCGEVCKEYAKTFYLGTMLMTEERRRAIWAIYVWCRRTDELVDGPNSSHTTPTALDRWEKRLADLFEGRPYDLFDSALSDTVARFPIDIQPFKDMIEGMRQDLRKPKYLSFDELYLYCYYVAGTVGLMCVPVMGIAPSSKASVASVYDAALALGIANQLTNILRDVGEEGRIYLPQDELESAGLSEKDVFEMKVTDKWRSFMKGQIRRARMYFDEAEKGITELDLASRWPVSASLMLYRQILDAIEANDYNNFTKRAYIGNAKKFLTLPAAYAKTLFHQSNKTFSGGLASGRSLLLLALVSLQG